MIEERIASLQGDITMIRIVRCLAYATLVLAVVTAPAWSQGKGKGPEKVPPQDDSTIGDKVREVLPASQPVFATQEVTLIRNWFQTNRSNLPPGLAKRETLPPGLQKQLEKNGALPPGLQKKIQPFPPELERQLSQVPTGYKRVVIAGNVILMDTKTSVIYDVIRAVIP
ncbi:MAG: hypothetical protein A3F68_03420 [Acidobacteria bacterium RIFCSPLOWO2_12_FULL_54_10]|nr:MAG: hypothetical protein A3F68_03420 [Acidobacteria bacterium RIFCSPLOWO2_12_FULL_54_10]